MNHHFATFSSFSLVPKLCRHKRRNSCIVLYTVHTCLRIITNCIEETQHNINLNIFCS
ncbi:hypothetical protein MtrunA17_Chr4g0055771 [Medicago truncatula]|uniref:Uncharacterized protein n=1 Tax=Medicago truncatula TaxID=3880 RepID=I3STE3_MEDTR|nr:unknown [Medicago truncatula]RHN63203.1 hypothetical protein MtrunA17_Chr4g0055771 [Medicago truncatula]